MTKEHQQILMEMQKKFEGVKRFPYDDATGKPPEVEGNLTIGVGYNLSAHGLPADIIEELHLRLLAAAENELVRNYPWYSRLDEPRQMAVLDMMYNLGPTKFRTFTGFISMMARGAFIAASSAMLHSLWAGQVGHRATILSNIIRTGELPVL